MTAPLSPRLLAIDLGLKMGYAMFGPDGRLLRYQARKISGRPQLKAAIHDILKTWAPTTLYVEGGGGIADLWIRQAEKNDLPVTQVHAPQWREELLYQRQRRTGADAKRHATAMALKIIEWSAAKRPTSMRHDVAEAIAFGLWAVIREGWLPDVPREISGKQ